MPTSDDDLAGRRFLVQVKGYDRDEVEAFRAEAVARIGALEQQVVEQRATAPQTSSEVFTEIGQQTARVLEAAQEAGDQLRRQARAEAQSLRESAQAQATQTLQQAGREADELRGAARAERDELESQLEARRTTVEREITALEVTRDRLVEVLRAARELVARGLDGLGDARGEGGDAGISTHPAVRARGATAVSRRAPAGETAPGADRLQLDLEEEEEEGGAGLPAFMAAPTEHGEQQAHATDELAPVVAGPDPREEDGAVAGVGGTGSVGADAEPDGLADAARVDAPELPPLPDEPTRPDGDRDETATLDMADVLTEHESRGGEEELAVPEGSGDGRGVPEEPSDDAQPTARRAERPGTPARALRTKALAPLHPKMVRRLKRGLTELQETTVARLREAEDLGAVDDLLPTPTEMTGFGHLAESFLEQAFEAGAAAASTLSDRPLTAPAPPQQVVDGFAEEAAARVAGPLHLDLEAGIAEREPAQALSARVGTVFDLAKRAGMDDIAAAHLIIAYEQGMDAALATADLTREAVGAGPGARRGPRDAMEA